jgi:UDP-N-acetylmuramate dehydrogenase
MLNGIPNLKVAFDIPLSEHTRFGVGGPARIFADASDETAFMAAIQAVHSQGVPLEVIGAGTNLIVSDQGFDGVILRYTANQITANETQVTADAGAVLQTLVDFTIDRGLSGMHTMTGIPGWLGAAVYGNAGAYGRSIHQSVESVRFFDGQAIQQFTNEQCRFRYRESIFKDHKGWIVFSTTLRFTNGDAPALREQADGILKIRNEKYPPTMKCAGSIFKNIIFDELPVSVQKEVPPNVIREGKVPSAFFLEAVGAKGMRNGDIHVADYHANLIYNAGQGTATQVCEIIKDLKQRVRARFNFEVQEEVQYVGFGAGERTG